MNKVARLAKTSSGMIYWIQDRKQTCFFPTEFPVSHSAFFSRSRSTVGSVSTLGVGGNMKRPEMVHGGCVVTHVGALLGQCNTISN